MALKTVDFDPNNIIIRLAIQALAGTPEPMTGANVLQFDNINKDIGQGDKNIVRYGSQKVTSHKNRRSGFSGDTAWRHADAAGALDVTDGLLRMGGMNPDTTDPTKVVYNEADLSNVDMSTWDSFDDISTTESYLNMISDSRAVLGFVYKAGDAFKWKASILGKYHQPSVADVIVPDWGTQQSNIGSDLIDAALENDAVQLDGKTLCLVEATTDNMRRVKSGRSINTCPTEAGLTFADGQISLTFRTPHYVDDWNPSVLHDSERLVTLKLKGGTEVGKRFIAEYAAVQSDSAPTYGTDSEGKATTTMVFNIESKFKWTCNF